MESISSNPTIILGFGILTFAVVVILLGVVIHQNRKIQYLTKPRYGFMGKPLALIAFAMIGIAATGSLFLANQPKTPDSVSVTDKDQVVITIEHKIINPADRNYEFNAIPIINDVNWGIYENLKMDIKWEVESLEFGDIQSKTETDISESHPGNVNFNLKPGNNRVTAYVNIGNFSYIGTKDIVVK